MVHCEFIVSSNSCYQPEKQSEIQRNFPGIKWLFNPVNGGFAYGMNRGLEIATGDFLLISNPDVQLLTTLESALQFLGEHPEVGALGPQILDEKGYIQDSCRPFMSLRRFIVRQVMRICSSRAVILQHKYNYNRTTLVDWCIGAFILIRRESYQKVGGLDENYFLYVEDMDWCYRIHQAGYQVYYYPELKIRYRGDRKSTQAMFLHGFDKLKYSYQHGKSYCRFLRKYPRNIFL